MNKHTGLQSARIAALLVTFWATQTYAQVTPRFGLSPDTTQTRSKVHTVFQLEAENGGMIPNNKDIKEAFGDIYYSGVNFRVGWQTQKATGPYAQMYHYPIYGIGVYASTFRKPEIGTPTALYGFVAVPIMPGRYRRWDFNYRISLGMASNFQTYNELTNPDNLMIGSHRTVYIDLGALANYKLSPHYQLGVGLAFHHFSNGSLRQPNKGINLLPLTVALTYHPGETKPDLSPGPALAHERDVQYHLQLAQGFKQYSLDNRKRYYKATLSAYQSYSFGFKFRLGLGLDLFYSDSGRDLALTGKQQVTMGTLFSSGAVFYIDHVLTDRLYINGNVGYYLKRNAFNGELKPMYLRLGLRYKVYKNSYAGVSIKAHMGKADFIECTLGHSLVKKLKK